MSRRESASDRQVFYARLGEDGLPDGPWHEIEGASVNFANMGRMPELTFKATVVNPELLAMLIGPEPELKVIGALVYEETYEDGVSLVTKKVTYTDGRTSYSASIVRDRAGAEVGERLWAYEVLCTAAWDGQMSVVLVEWPHRAAHVSVVGKRITGPRGFADFIAELHFGTNLSERAPGWAHG